MEVTIKLKYVNGKLYSRLLANFRQTGEIDIILEWYQNGSVFNAKIITTIPFNEYDEV